MAVLALAATGGTALAAGSSGDAVLAGDAVSANGAPPASDAVPARNVAPASDARLVEGTSSADSTPANSTPADNLPADRATAFEAAPEAVPGGMPATVVTAILAEVRSQVPVSGTLVAERQVQIFARIAGFEIVEIAADAGDQVKKGQVLARLSDDTVRARLEQADAEYQRAEAGLGQARSQVGSAEASLVQAQAALDRAQRLRDSGNTSQAALDQALAAEAAAQAAAASSHDGVAVATAQLAQAAAARDVARLDLEHTRITAPVDGLIVERKAELGALSGGSGELLFTLVADGRIELAGEVIETALKDLAAGQPALLRVAGVGDVTGTVRRIPASVDSTTRLGVVRIALDHDAPLRVGLFANGWITTERREAITVPAGAVLATEAGDVVQVVAGGRVTTRPVEAGLLWQGRREIRAGLAAGEVVVARAGAFFRDGDPVAAIPADETAGAAP